MSEQVRIGLYRHFKGRYYYVTNVAKSYNNYKEVNVIYFDVCNPSIGSFSRPVWDFLADNDTYDLDDKGERFAVGTPIKDRVDNVTGQYHRFERVEDLNFQLSSISTEQLIDELSKRVDSPIHELDIDGLRSPVFCSDYVVGIKHKATEETPNGVDTINVFFTQDEAEKFFSNQAAKARKGVFKRTFIELDT